MENVIKRGNIDEIKEIFMNRSVKELSLGLIIAADGGNYPVVDYFLQSGADPNYENSSALKWASYRGFVDIVRILISNGANINPKRISSPLYEAVDGRHFEIVQLLVDSGANVIDRDALEKSLDNQDKEISVYLLEKILERAKQW